MFHIAGYAAVLAISVVAAVVGVRSVLYGPSTEPMPSTVATIDVDPKLVARNLSHALRIQTLSRSRDLPPEAEAFAEFHDFLRARYSRVHEAMTRETVAEHSLLYTWEGTSPSLNPILFSAHMDVVPVEPGTESDWTYPAFSGEVAEGFIWGRGSLDMKQSLLGYMEAAELLISEDFAPERTIFFAFGHDEEVGGENGAGSIAKLLAERGIEPEFVLDEGSAITLGIVPGVERAAAIIGVTEKGIAEIQLVAVGEGGHSARPPSDNPIAQIGRAIAALQANPMPARLQSPVTDMFDRLSPEMPFTSRLIVTNRWLFEPLLLKRLSKGLATNASIRSTITPTIIEGGVKSNVIPQKVSATLNIRLLPGDTLDGVLQHITRTTGAALVSDGSNGFNCEPVPCLIIRVSDKKFWRAASVSDVESLSFRALTQSVVQIFPDVAIAPGMVLGITDSRHYRALTDNIFRFVPMRLTRSDLRRIHGTNERISVDNYVEIIRFYMQLVVNTAVNFEPDVR